jgi:hypothetical protein
MRIPLSSCAAPEGRPVPPSVTAKGHLASSASITRVTVPRRVLLQILQVGILRPEGFV